MREIIGGLLKKPTHENLERLRREYARKHGKVLSNADILAECSEEERAELKVLKTKPVRSLSGITVLAVMYPGFKCPGECIYCPTSEIAPKSYTGYEPATRRARSNEFDPYRQVTNRLKQLREGGHVTDKCELIVMGGTFPSEKPEYQAKFVKRCFDALNGKTSKTLRSAQMLNESARNRCTGLTVETRPDFCSQKEINVMLGLGATRVELGVQSIYDDVLKKVSRGHSVEATAKASMLAREAGMKVVYHIMPGLPGSDKKRDVEMFRGLFSDPRFRPDMMKIYPCLVIPGTKLHEMWKKGEYVPYSAEDIVDVVAKATNYFPRYLRIMRMQRDIPINKIAAGSQKSNITELVAERLAEEERSCPCIRCREVGRRGVKVSDLGLEKIEYEASGGKEVFLSYEDKGTDSIAAFLRLRLGSIPVVRELRVYGEQVPIGRRISSAKQHFGLGKSLLEEAERIAGGGKLYVLSGIGTKPYYRNLGYRDDGFYVSKEIGKKVKGKNSHD
ncbi:MAG: tRNA uridine(34) 5-carboxymethylaminomethyl modification radical SAM/GNAT enzyme Elp3 [archaeon]